MIKFGRQRAETLDPEYFDCNACDRIEKDKAKGCPKCELVTMHEDYRSEIVADTLYFHRDWPKGWTLDEILKAYGEVADVLERSKRRIKRSWNVRLARLCRIYLSEQNQARAVENFKITRPKPDAGGPVRTPQTLAILKRVNNR